MKQYSFDPTPGIHSPWNLKHESLKAYFGSSDCIPMWSADMDFQACDEIRAALRDFAEQGVYGYTKRGPDFFGAIANWFQVRHGLAVDTKMMVQAPGVIQLVGACVRAFSEPHDRIVVVAPTYWQLYKCVSGQGRNTVQCHMRYENGHYALDMAQLQHDLIGAKMLILCSPNNPTGRVYAADELRAVFELCKRNGAVLVTDEIHSDFVYAPHQHTPLLSVVDDPEARAVMVISTSKSFNLAGLTSATAIVSNKDVHHAIRKQIDKLNLDTANVFSCVAAQAAYEHGADWLEQCKQYIQGNYILLRDALAAANAPIRLADLQATFLAWLDCTELCEQGVDLQEFFGKKARIAGDEGKKFGRPYKTFYRLNLATSRANVQLAADRIIELL